MRTITITIKDQNLVGEQVEISADTALSTINSMWNVTGINVLLILI